MGRWGGGGGGGGGGVSISLVYRQLVACGLGIE